MRKLGALFIGLALSVPVAAQTAITLPYSGRMFDSTDTPFNGTIGFRFRIVDRSIPNFPSPDRVFWDATKTATVANGYLSVVLGEAQDPPLIDEFFGDGARYLEITPAVNSAPLMPRVTFGPGIESTERTAAENYKIYSSITIEDDVVAPVIRIGNPVNGAEFELGEAVGVSYYCTDVTSPEYLESGLSQCVGSIPNGALLNTSAQGTFVFQVAAEDRAGNVSTSLVTYSVVRRTGPPFERPGKGNPPSPPNKPPTPPGR